MLGRLDTLILMKSRAVGLLALAVFCPGLCRAESLYDAIQMAYQTSPELGSQRSALEATNEGYVQARAGLGPQANVSGQFGYQNAQIQGGNVFSPRGTTTYQAGTGSADLSIVQPLFASGGLTARVDAAAATVQAGRQDLRASESGLLQKVIVAYVDVLRDRETVSVVRDELAALTGEVKEAKAMQALGALSKTDVAQAQARLLLAQSQFNLIRGRLSMSNAEYASIVGQTPGELAPVPELAGIPSSVDEAFETAEQNNPQIAALVNTEQAARAKVTQAKAENGPQISMRFDATTSPVEPYLPEQYDRNVTIAAVISQPLFTSGLNRSRVREALDNDNRAELDIVAAKRQAMQAVAQIWEQLLSSQSALELQQQQIDVQEQAVKGSRIEQRAGVRPLIDLLNAEAELASDRVSILQSRHDQYLAQAALLSEMGLLEVRFLTPQAASYDPAMAFRKVENAGAAPWEGVVGAVDGLAGKPKPAPTPVMPGRPLTISDILAASP
jgi:outer membrane protein